MRIVRSPSRSTGFVRAALSVAAAWTAVACAETSSSPARLALDERVPSGRARAGVIARDSELVGGLTSRGRIGDFKLYNSRIAIVVGPPGAGRGFHPYGGTIIDADRIRPAGDPGKSTFGEVIVSLDLAVLHPTSAEVVRDGRDGGEARVRLRGHEDVMPLFDSIFSELFPPTRHDMEWMVDYVVEPDVDWVRIEYTMVNKGGGTIEFGLPGAGFIFGDGARPFMPGYGFRPPAESGFAAYYAAIADEASYLYGRIGEKVSVVLSESGIVIAGIGESFQLRGGETKTFTHHLVIGDGDLARTQALWRRAAGLAAGTMVSGRVSTPSGKAVLGARVHVTRSDAEVPERDYVSMARSDAEGRYVVSLEPGAYRAVAVADGRVRTDTRAFEIVEGRSTLDLDFTIEAPGTVRYVVTDAEQRKIPAKLSVRRQIATEGDLPPLPAHYGESTQANGLFSTVFAIAGEGTFSVPRGTYDIFVSRGAEYEIAEKRVTVASGAESSIQAVLERSVSTEGWMSTDTHIHSQLSPDSPDLYALKVSAMVTEGLEIPVSTEHEAIGDFNPAIRELGVTEWIQGIIGSEVTTYAYGHFNAFPLERDPAKPGNGRIEWYKKAPAETFAAIRANPGDPFLQVNHPRSNAIGGYLAAMGFDADAFTFRRPREFSFDFDALEVANGCDVDRIEHVTQRDWFAFLNHGHRIYATGSTDNHRAETGNMGYPRTYLRMPTDDPAGARIDDVRASLKAGRMIVSCGPFVEMALGGAEIGDTATVESADLELRIRVAAPTWMDVDELDVIVNGEVMRTIPIASSEVAERFRGVVTVPRPDRARDGWVIARVRGDTPHGLWARRGPSYAFTNPIFLDGNDDGAWVMP